MQRRILPLIFTIIILYSLAFAPAHASVSPTEDVKIELSLVHQILRGEIIVISGRLSTVVGNYPIALAWIHFQYFRSGDPYFTREVTIISSNPGGLFEDRFNTTSLLRIGTWFVNASFPSQYGYRSASTVESFTVVVQPALSLYVSSHRAALNRTVSFDGLLFACIPCIQDEVTVIITRPENNSVSLSLRLFPTGGPYPGGYYSGSFTPDVPGLWHLRAVWKGNEVTLPAYSDVEEVKVDAPGLQSDNVLSYWIALAIVAVCVSVFAVLLWRRHTSESQDVPR